MGPGDRRKSLLLIGFHWISKASTYMFCLRWWHKREIRKAGDTTAFIFSIYYTDFSQYAVNVILAQICFRISCSDKATPIPIRISWNPIKRFYWPEKKASPPRSLLPASTALAVVTDFERSHESITITVKFHFTFFFIIRERRYRRSQTMPVKSFQTTYILAFYA